MRRWFIEAAVAKNVYFDWNYESVLLILKHYVRILTRVIYRRFTGYQGEPSNQRIPSNKYIYQGQPLGQRNLSVQNSGERDPSEHRTPSRQNSSPAQLPSQSILSRQHNYQGQPFGQCNLSVQNSNQDERPYDCIPSRQNSEFDGASNLASGQQGTPTWYLGQSPNLPGPGQYLGSQVHYVPG